MNGEDTCASGSAATADRDELQRIIEDAPAEYITIEASKAVADAILASDWFARVRADEREACAKVADRIAGFETEKNRETNIESMRMPYARGAQVAETVAAAIRERNQ